MNESIHPADLEQSPFTGETEDASMAIEQAKARPFVDRADPIAVKEAISEVLSSQFWTGITDHRNAAHPFDGLCKVCLVKEPAIETPLDVKWRKIDGAEGWFPVNCCEECYAAAKVDTARLTANREFWERVCPIEFRKDWDNRRGDRGLLNRVMEFDIKKKRGLMVHGPSDSGKTRAIWHLLRKLSEDGVAWLFIESIDLLDNIPAEAFNVQLLVIDDLGNDHLASQKEVRLLKLIRARCNWHRPFIVTTQFNGDSLRKRFSEGATATALIRRLREYCDGVEARPTIKTLTQ